MPEQATTADWTLPVKRVTGETLSDRLTDQVQNHVLPSRYLEKDEHGNVVEDVEDVFERVAKNVALADAVYKATQQGTAIEVTPDQIKPNHPRRGELAAEVFGYDNREFADLDAFPDDLEDARDHLIDDTVELTERNVSKFAYDTIVPEIDDETVRAHVVEVKDEFQEAMERLSLMPNSPTIMNAGKELQQLSACFVMSPKDDLDNIFNTAREAARTFKSGGGCGYAFSDLRPYGDTVGSTGGIASGPITFMESYDAMCETIAQGGVRRGAQMGVMRVTHPDIIQFIHAKNKDVSLAHCLRLNDPDDFTHSSFAEALEEARELIDEEGRVPEHLRNAVEGHLSNFNISVGVTDDFMEAVKNDDEYTLINPATGEAHIATEHTKELYERFNLGEYVTVGEELVLPANEIMDRIVEGAHENGEPGLLMIDRANHDHSFPVESSPGPDHDQHEILASNPCGEQFLKEYEACNLAHINLSTLVAKEPEYDSAHYEADSIESLPTHQDFRAWHAKECAEGYDGPRDDPDHIAKFLDQAINWEEFNHRIDLGIRFLDNVVTMSDFPVPKVEEVVRNNRKIGLGIMGLAQLFIQLGVRYGSSVSNEMTEQLMVHINRRGKAMSHDLAVNEERGSFNTHGDSKYADPIEYREWFEHQTGEDADEWADGFPIRNHNVTTIAPTGTTSLIANTTGGCEPIYSVINFRNPSDDIQEGLFVEVDDYFMRALEANGIDSEAVKEEAKAQMEANEYEGISGLSRVPDNLSELFVTTQDLTPKQHADIQCAAQQGVDSSISKTINAPNDTTVEDTREVFLYVYENGGKGVTYYRDGTRSKQVKTTRKQNKQFADADDDEVAEILLDNIHEAYESIFEFVKEEAVQDELRGNITTVTELVDEDILPAGYAPKRPRPKTLSGVTVRIETGYGDVYVNINEDENGDPFEVFCDTGHSGDLYNSWTDALAMTISVAIRSGVDIREIIDVLKDVRAPKKAWDNGDRIDSIPDGIAVALERYLNGDLQDPRAGQQQLSDVSDPATNGHSSSDTAGARTDGNGTQTVDTDVAEGQAALIEAGESPHCPQCDEAALYFSEGCKTCDACGWSEC